MQIPKCLTVYKALQSTLLFKEGAILSPQDSEELRTVSHQSDTTHDQYLNNCCHHQHPAFPMELMIMLLPLLLSLVLQR